MTQKCIKHRSPPNNPPSSWTLIHILSEVPGILIIFSSDILVNVRAHVIAYYHNFCGGTGGSESVSTNIWVTYGNGKLLFYLSLGVQ
jgi:hypothetical protein